MEKRLSEISYFKTGGTADCIASPTSADELSQEIKTLSLQKTPFYVLGLGSNSLVLDEHFNGAVITLKNMRSSKINGAKVFCEAGLTNTEFAEIAATHHLSGAGWMNFLPGEIGGTVRMNARCYGGEIGQIVTAVHAVSKTGEIKTYDQPQKVFRGYKDTLFMENGDVIYAAEMTLEKSSDIQETRALMEKCRADREKKDQFIHPSCGCVFKNDYTVGVPSGMLLEYAGAKSLRRGDASVSPNHANFVYNLGRATSNDILHVTFLMREAVYLEFGVWLEYEMEVLGNLAEPNRSQFFEKRTSQPNIKVEKLREKFRGLA